MKTASKIFLFFSVLTFSFYSAISIAKEKKCLHPRVKIIGPEEVVYAYESEHCSKADTPDSPAMAFKNQSGKVILFNGLAGSYPSTGNHLNNVKRECKRGHLFDNNPDSNAGPEVFFNQTWLRDPWTEDGKTIYALVHNEWDNGPAGWYPNVVAAKSEDGGKTFKIVKGPHGKSVLAIVTPYKYNPQGSPQGMAQQSNILSKVEDGKRYYYVLVLNSVGYGHEGGDCLFRSDDISDPSRWRAWDGDGFKTAMNVNLYRDPEIDPEKHICKPIIKDFTTASWRYNTVLNQYLAIGHMQIKKENGEPGEAFGYSVSDDMIHWSKPVPLKEVNWLMGYRDSKPGSGVVGQAYPSLLDPESEGLNYEFSGEHPYLYYTRMPPKMSGVSWHRRDLVRVPLEVSCRHSTD